MFIFLYADRVIEDVLVVIKSHTHILFRIIKDSLEVIYPIGHDPCDWGMLESKSFLSDLCLCEWYYTVGDFDFDFIVFEGVQYFLELTVDDCRFSSSKGSFFLWIVFWIGFLVLYDADWSLGLFVLLDNDQRSGRIAETFELIADLIFEFFHLLTYFLFGAGKLDEFLEGLILRKPKKFSSKFLEDFFIGSLLRVSVAFLNYSDCSIHSFHDQISIIFILPKAKFLVLFVRLIFSSLNIDVLRNFNIVGHYEIVGLIVKSVDFLDRIFYSEGASCDIATRVVIYQIYEDFLGEDL